jgi:hypothetical protein
MQRDTLFLPSFQIHDGSLDRELEKESDQKKENEKEKMLDDSRTREIEKFLSIILLVIRLISRQISSVYDDHDLEHCRD